MTEKPKAPTESDVTSEMIEAVAETLYMKMEHLEPRDSRVFSELSDHEKEFYRACVEAVMAECLSYR